MEPERKRVRARRSEALRVLRTATAFTGPYVGMSIVPPVTVEAFRLILEDPGADDAFKALLTEATPSGRLYALAGLYFTDRSEMHRRAAAFLRDDSRIETMFGCVVDHQPVSELAAQILDGSLPQSFRGPA